MRPKRYSINNAQVPEERYEKGPAFIWGLIVGALGIIVMEMVLQNLEAPDEHRHAGPAFYGQELESDRGNPWRRTEGTAARE